MQNDMFPERDYGAMNQCDRAVAYMEDFGAITTLDAIRDLGILRLGARISELRSSGYIIEGTDVHVTDRWGNKSRPIKEYRLVSKPNESV